MTENRMKQRLIGAVTLVSLAVIFLPVIFDGSGDSDLPGIKLDIPARPQLIFDQHFENLPGNSKHDLQSLREEIDLKQLGSGWVIQTGVFTHVDAAKEQIAALLLYGYKAKYIRINSDNGLKFIVTFNAGEDKTLAEDTAREIEEKLKIKVSVTQKSAIH